MELQGIGIPIGGQRGRFAVLAHEPLHLVDVQGVRDPVLGVPRQRVGGRRRHAALLDELHASEAAGRVQPGHEAPEALDEVGLAEQPGSVGIPRPSARTRDQRVAHEGRPAADPPHAAGDPRATQYAQCRSNSASDPSSEPPPPECEETTSRRSSSIVPTEIGENDSGYLEAGGARDVMSRFLPDWKPDRTRRQVCAHQGGGWNSITGTPSGG